MTDFGPAQGRPSRTMQCGPGVAGMTRKRGIFGAHGGVAGRQDGQFAAGAAER